MIICTNSGNLHDKNQFILEIWTSIVFVIMIAKAVKVAGLSICMFALIVISKHADLYIVLTLYLFVYFVLI